MAKKNFRFSDTEPTCLKGADGVSDMTEIIRRLERIETLAGGDQLAGGGASQQATLDRLARTEPASGQASDVSPTLSPSAPGAPSLPYLVDSDEEEDDAGSRSITGRSRTHSAGSSLSRSAKALLLGIPDAAMFDQEAVLVQARNRIKSRTSSLDTNQSLHTRSMPGSAGSSFRGRDARSRSSSASNFGASGSWGENSGSVGASHRANKLKLKLGQLRLFNSTPPQGGSMSASLGRDRSISGAWCGGASASSTLRQKQPGREESFSSKRKGKGEGKTSVLGSVGDRIDRKGAERTRLGYSAGDLEGAVSPLRQAAAARLMRPITQGMSSVGEGSAELEALMKLPIESLAFSWPASHYDLKRLLSATVAAYGKCVDDRTGELLPVVEEGAAFTWGGDAAMREPLQATLEKVLQTNAAARRSSLDNEEPQEAMDATPIPLGGMLQGGMLQGGMLQGGMLQGGMLGYDSGGQAHMGYDSEGYARMGYAETAAWNHAVLGGYPTVHGHQMQQYCGPAAMSLHRGSMDANLALMGVPTLPLGSYYAAGVSSTMMPGDASYGPGGHLPPAAPMSQAVPPPNPMWSPPSSYAHPSGKALKATAETQYHVTPPPPPASPLYSRPASRSPALVPLHHIDSSSVPPPVEASKLSEVSLDEWPDPKEAAAFLEKEEARPSVEKPAGSASLGGAGESGAAGARGGVLLPRPLKETSTNPESDKGKGAEGPSKGSGTRGKPRKGQGAQEHAPGGDFLQVVQTVKTCAQNRKLKEAIVIVESLHAQHPGPIAAKSMVGWHNVYNSLISGCVRCGSLPEVHKALARMASYGIPPNIATYNSLISGRGKLSTLEDAIRTFDELSMLELTPDVVTYNSLIDACVRHGDFDRGQELLVEMKKQGLKPNEITFTALISGYAKHSMFNKAFELLADMAKCGIEPNQVTYSALIDACMRCDEFKAASDIMAKMEEAGLERNVVTYNIIISGCGRNGKAQEAEIYFREMVTAGLAPSQVTYNSLICAQVRAMELKRAFAVRDEMLEAGFVPDRVTFNTLVMGCAKCRQVDEAFSLAREMEQQGLQADQITYTALIDACSRSSQMHRAHQVLQTMVAQGIAPDLITCNTLVNGYTKNGDLELAIQILEVISQQSDLSPDTYTLRPILDLSVSMGGGMLDRILAMLQVRLKMSRGDKGGNLQELAAMCSALIDACMSMESGLSLAVEGIRCLEGAGLVYASQSGFTAPDILMAAEKGYPGVPRQGA